MIGLFLRIMGPVNQEPERDMRLIIEKSEQLPPPRSLTI